MISQRRAVPSLAVVKSQSPLGEKIADVTPFLWPLNHRTSRPVKISHRATLPSSLVVQIQWLSEETTAEVAIIPLGLSRRRNSRPVETSHRCVVAKLPRVKSTETSAVRRN